MKNIGVLIIISVLISFLPSCKEIGPDINLKNNPHAIADTTYVETPVAAEPKNVVIEEFTGVQCTNCPQGHQIIDGLVTANPGRIVAVSLHPQTPLGFPMQGLSVTDLEDLKSQAIYVSFGSPFLPSGMIDRRLFSGESAVPVDKSTWATYTANELTQTTPVNLLLSRTYDSTNQQLTVVAELHYTQAVSQLNSLTIELIENNIITAQKNGAVIDTFYVHNDVLRDILTANQGDNITDSLQAGRVVRKIYKAVINAAWKPKNMNIAAFVGEYQNSKVIYQGKELSVQ